MGTGEMGNGKVDRHWWFNVCDVPVFAFWSLLLQFEKKSKQLDDQVSKADKEYFDSCKKSESARAELDASICKVTDGFMYLKLLYFHRRRSSVNFGGKTFLPQNICIKINKMWEFCMVFAGKINKIPELYMIFACKNIFPQFLGATAPPLLYCLLCLCLFVSRFNCDMVSWLLQLSSGQKKTIVMCE